MKSIVLLMFFLVSIPTIAQNELNNRYIEVKGNAEIEIEPDEILLSITIEEYWKEEFEKKKDFEDYKNKVLLAEIEDQLIKNLRKAGINKEDIVVQNIGNYYRYRGKEFLFSKRLEVNVTDLSKINKLMQLADAKGIKSMTISELKHSRMDEFKKEVKIKALQDAREKAKYLLESIDEELGKVQFITEINDGFSRPIMATTMYRATEMAPESIDQVKNITLSYELQARFNIK